MINRYLKGFYINFLSFSSRIIYWLTIFFSFADGELFFIHEEWILFLVFTLIIWHISSLVLKEKKLILLDEDKQHQSLKRELKIAFVITGLITIFHTSLMIILKSYESIIFIILMNVLRFYLFRLINKQIEVRILENQKLE